MCSFRGGQCSRGTSAPLFHSSNHQSASFRILSFSPMHHIYQGERERARGFLLLRFSIKTPVAIGIKRPIHESALFRSRRYTRFVNGYGPRALVTGTGSDLARARAAAAAEITCLRCSKGVINVGGAGLSPRPINRGHGAPQYVREARR